MTFQPPQPPPPPPPPPSGPPPGHLPGASGQSVPPPPPPPGQPYGSPPPPGQPYGSPASPPPSGWSPASSPAGRAFDPKRVDPLDWGIIAAGFLAFIFSFVSYYTFSLKGLPRGVNVSGSESAWHGFFGWFAMLLALVGSAAIALEIFRPDLKLPVANKLVALGSYAVATLSVIIALLVVPNAGSGPLYDEYISEGHGAGYWISLIVIIAGLVLSFLRFSQSGGVLPFGPKRPSGGAPPDQPR